MAAYMKYVVLMFIFTAASSIRPVSSSSASAFMCNPISYTFIHDLRLQCPPVVSLSAPLEVDGEYLDRALSSDQADIYIAVLFYASCCPFSSAVRPKFAFLSSMFPQIKHLMVKQSSALPSVFSRYGIHSVPSIMIVNQTVRARYHGQKDLHSLVHFYKKTTGLDPVVDLTQDHLGYSEGGEKVLKPWNGASLKEISMKEPYLVLSIMFLILRAFLYFLPKMVSRLMALWAACVPHLNLGIFGESRQLLGRVLHLIDVKRVWSKLKLCKNRSFHRGARSARVGIIPGICFLG